MSPAPTPSPNATDPAVQQMLERKNQERRRLVKEITANLQQTLPTHRVGFTYVLGLIAAMIVFLLLIALYLLLIALLTAGVYYHAVRHTGILTMARGRGAIVAFAAYCAPIAAGLVAIFFMIKPLFARRSVKEGTVTIKKAAEPDLDALIQHLCRAVNAPMPHDIQVTSEVNASAMSKRALWLIGPRRIVVSVGMPLVMTLSVGQLLGVLAHEIGHCRQRSAMGVNLFVRALCFWFARVVYERDAWDDALRSAAVQEHWLIYSVVQFCLGVVWLTRRFLWLLMTIGNVFASYLMRQQEHDADAIETKIAGTETTVSIHRELFFLQFAHHRAMIDLSRSWADRQLTDNFPRLVRANRQLLSKHETGIEASYQSYLSQSTRLFDTHPSTQERIARSEAMNEPGLVRADQSALMLFHHPDEISRRVTLVLYKAMFGKSVPKSSLVRFDEYNSSQAESEEQFKALREFLVVELPDPVRVYPNSTHALARRGIHSDFIKVDVMDDVPLPDRESLVKRRTRLVQSLQAARGRVAHALSAKKVSRDDVNSAHARWTILSAGRCSRQWGIEIPNEIEELANKDLGTLNAEALNLKTKLDRAAKPWRLLAKAQGDRLALTLELLDDPSIAAKLDPEGDVNQRVENLLAVMRALTKEDENLQHCRATLDELRLALTLAMRKNECAAATAESMFREARSMITKIFEIRRRMKDLPYPYEHGRGAVSLGEYLPTVGSKVTDFTDFVRATEHAGNFLEKVSWLQARALANLAAHALDVEKLLAKHLVQCPLSPPDGSPSPSNERGEPSVGGIADRAKRSDVDG